MKKLIIISFIILTAFAYETKANPLNMNYGYGMFYTQLAPYGRWIEIDNGLIVWRPTIMSMSWAPYERGQWIWTADGWYWDSYEPFGYITYHYGRWYYDDYYGWIWVPDDQWAPAWVEWRYDNDYIGWSPLPPYAVFTVNIGIHFTFNYYTPYYRWHFVRYRHFCEPYVYNHFMGPTYRYRIYSQTKYRTNYDYRDGRIRNRGVDVEFIRNRGGQRIVERRIESVRDPKELKVRDRNSSTIRTYMPSRDEINRENVRGSNLKIEKSDRRSTLEISKVDLSGVRNRDNTRINENPRMNTPERNDRIRKTETKRTPSVVTPRVKAENKRIEEKRTPVRENNDVRKTETRREYKPSVPATREKVNEKREVQRTPAVNQNRNNTQRKTEVRRTETRNQPNVQKRSNTNSRNNNSRNDNSRNDSKRDSRR